MVTVEVMETLVGHEIPVKFLEVDEVSSRLLEGSEGSWAASANWSLLAGNFRKQHFLLVCFCSGP
jgi:hypothetical protein